MAHLRTCKPALAFLIGTLCAVLALSSPADAVKPGAESFQGVCEMSGAIRHQPPLRQVAGPVRVHGSFSGVCWGELTDRQGRPHRLDGAPAEYDGRGAGELSCVGGVATGTGRLLFDRGWAIEFGLTERRGPGVAVVTLEGATGGSGVVLGTVSRDEDLADINERCSGAGVRLLRGDARIASPGISG